MARWSKMARGRTNTSLCRLSRHIQESVQQEHDRISNYVTPVNMTIYLQVVAVSQPSKYFSQTLSRNLLGSKISFQVDLKALI